jgi:muramoyltetrapeptide carboxypeptidase
VTAVIPPRVRPGELVGVCAPAGPIRAERLARGVARLGEAFRVTVAPSLGAPQPAGAPPYLAASDAQRADELGALLRDPDVRAIVLARGGYGLMRILPLLDPDALRRDPKPIVGFSDATALLAWAHGAAGVRGIHGPMVGQLGELPASDAAYLIALLSDPRAPGVRPWRLETTGRGTVRGPVVPANLTMASLLVATPWPVPLAGAIALFEEINEKPYELDRYLTQLILTGTLTAAAAVVVGDLTRCTDPAPPPGEPGAPDEALRTVRERVAAAQKPCAVGAPVGHGARNEAIPFGAAAELDLDHGTLAILEPAVA